MPCQENGRASVFLSAYAATSLELFHRRKRNPIMASPCCLERAGKVAQPDPFLHGTLCDLEPFCDIAHGQVVGVRGFGRFV